MYKVSKNSHSTDNSPPVFCTQQDSALYLASHRVTISTNIHSLRPVFTIKGYTGLKVRNILSAFYWQLNGKKVANTMFLHVCQSQFRAL